MDTHMRIVFVLLALIGSAAPARAQPSEEPHSFGYARLGYGSVVADRTRQAPAIGFGFRAEARSLGVDISFLNYIVDTGAYEPAAGVLAGSLLRLEALRFVDPERDRSLYYGGGLSWGIASVGRAPAGERGVPGHWQGGGLQGEATIGYEVARASPIRMFVQADLGIPFFRARSETYAYVPGAAVPAVRTVAVRYVPSAVVSVAVGWRRQRP
jgi:hypothetical protein